MNTVIPLTKCHQLGQIPMEVTHTFAISLVKSVIASQWVVEATTPVHPISEGKTLMTTEISWHQSASCYKAGNPPDPSNHYVGRIPHER